MDTVREWRRTLTGTLAGAAATTRRAFDDEEDEDSVMASENGGGFAQVYVATDGDRVMMELLQVRPRHWNGWHC
jgi:hypothetical protein